MKKKIFKYIELTSIVLSALIIWYLADNIFRNSFSNNWTWVMISMFIFFIVWSLGAIIIRDNKIFLGVTFLSLFLQIIFTRDFRSLAIIIFSFLSLWIARKYTRREIKLRLNVDIWNYLRVGKKFLILAIALMLAGQYYLYNDAQIASENLPKLKFNYGQDNFMTKIISFVDPDLIKENREALSVDEYIVKKFNDDPLASKRFGTGAGFSDINYNQQEVVLIGGRADISKMVERDVRGDENMIDIFLEIINNKVDDLTNVNVGYINKDMPVTHLIFTMAIFFAIMGVGMLANIFLVLSVAIIFRILIFINLLSIDKKATNMEIIRIG